MLLSLPPTEWCDTCHKPILISSALYSFAPYNNGMCVACAQRLKEALDVAVEQIGHQSYLRLEGTITEQGFVKIDWSTERKDEDETEAEDQA